MNIKQFQRSLHAEYCHQLSLPENYQYLYGNPVLPVVPVETAIGGILIVGAYPSARFATIGSERDVPVADNLSPFSIETYFDGTHTRRLESGFELEHQYLQPLGLSRGSCWITDLVRVFLFKPGHIKKYRQLDCSWPQFETRSKFEDYAIDGMDWFEKEIDVAQPRLIITLGADVAGILRGVQGRESRNDLISGKIQDLSVGDQKHQVIHLAHPGIVMRPASAKNRWPILHREKHVPEARTAIEKFL